MRKNNSQRTILFLLGRVHVLIHVFIFATVLGCSHKSTKDVSGLSIPMDEKLKMQNELQAANVLLESRQFLEAQKAYEDFFAQHSHSVFEAEAQLSYGRSLLGQGQYVESLTPFKAALGYGIYESLVWMAVAFEAMGDEPRVYATLTDAERNKDKLDLRTRMAELPARWAAYYHRQGQYEKAMQLFEQANKGLIQLQEGLPDQEQRSQLSQSYYKMGVLSLNQLGTENVDKLMDTLNILQLFLVRSMEQNQTTWSLMSLMNLKESYQVIYQFIVSNKNLSTTNRINLMEKLLTMQQKAKNYVLVVNDDNNSFLADWDRFMKDFETDAVVQLTSWNDKTPLTPESLERLSPKKSGLRLTPVEN